MYQARFWEMLVAFYAMTSVAQEQRICVPLPYAKSPIDPHHKGTHYEENLTLTHRNELMRIIDGDADGKRSNYNTKQSDRDITSD